MDSGEAEAIVLASEVSANLLLMDEKLGRYYARHADLNVTGTIGILIEAKRHGLINELQPVLYDLRDKNVWISDRLIIDVLKIVGELDNV